MSEYELEERINQYIQFLFRDEKNVVYNALVTFIINGNILGREITQTVLFDYLKNQKEPFVIKDGYIDVPTKPGLGVELDEEALMDKIYDGKWTTPRQYYEDGSNADW